MQIDESRGNDPIFAIDDPRRPGDFAYARGASGTDPAADLHYLQQWVAQHTGVEAFVEPRTTVTDVTVVLVAADGEWTRRRAGGDPAPDA